MFSAPSVRERRIFGFFLHDSATGLGSERDDVCIELITSPGVGRLIFVGGRSRPRVFTLLQVAREKVDVPIVRPAEARY